MIKKLFELIQKHEGRGRYMHVISNTTPTASPDFFAFIVHIKGGVHFEIFNDKGDIYIDELWMGCLERMEPVDILAWLKILEEQHS